MCGGGGGERWIANSHSSSVGLCLSETLKLKYCLLLADEEVNFRKVNNSMLHSLPDT